MNARPLTDEQISEALRAHLPEGAPGGLRELVLEAADATTQQRALPSFFGALTEADPVSRRRSLLIAAALLLALALASAAAAGALRLLQRDLRQDLSLEPRPSPQGIVAPSSTPSSPTPTPTPEILSLDLTWKKVDIEPGLGRVAWLGDRFVLVDAAGAVNTSADGVSWQVLRPGDPDPGYADLVQERTSLVTWEDDIVGWWNPDEGGPETTNAPPVTARDILRIVRPPAESRTTTPFKGRIESIGVGPRGIVAHVHSHLNYGTETNWDTWVASKLGKNWVSHVRDVRFEGGVLDIDMDNGPGLHVVWADEGFEPGDFQDRGFGWYSPDGVEWTAIPSDIPPALDRGDLPAFPTGLGEVVGVSDGFIARGIAKGDSCEAEGGCKGMWHSADGLTWRHLANVPSGSGDLLVPWKGGALATDGIGRFDLWTSQGYTELPMAADVPAPPQQGSVLLATGPLGLMSVRMDRKEILVTRDGADWKIQPMPAAMVTDSDRLPTIAVGDRSVLCLTWSGYFGPDGYVPSLWVGSLEP
jgi:hypothetical protein